ncbi:hypothetical protein [Loktanella salsilacus]|uniref:hypothetical protein n=1 Tax=Loktanella salsilacus TaxID=195913 RepID=UPI0030F90672
MKTSFLTYGANGFERNAHHLCESALRCGFDRVECAGIKTIAGTEFARRNRATLSLKRGGGYWVWKPYLIRERVNQLREGEILLYSDAGRTEYYQFMSFPACLLDRTARSKQGFLTGVSIPHLNLVGQATKRDCLKIMKADMTAIHKKPIIQSTWSVWTKTRPALNFLDEWLRFSEDTRCITDIPNTLGDDNLPGFVDHRHDQSISSILTHQLCAPYLDFSSRLVQQILNLRPNSELGQTFYKRVQNADDLLSGATPAILLREYLRLRNFR